MCPPHINLCLLQVYHVETSELHYALLSIIAALLKAMTYNKLNTCKVIKKIIFFAGSESQRNYALPKLIIRKLKLL